jgi:O-antigen ligase
MTALADLAPAGLGRAEARLFSTGSVVMTMLVALAFTPIFPGGDLYSTALTSSRVSEIAFLAASVAVGVFTTTRRRPSTLPTEALGPPGIALAFAAWAAFTALWSQLIITGTAKALELMLVVLAAYYTVLGARMRGMDRNALVNSVAIGIALAVVLLLALNVPLHGTPFPMEAADPDSPFPPEVRPRFYLGNAHPLTTGTLLAVGLVAAASARLRPAVKVPAAAGICVLLYLADARGVTAGAGLGLLLVLYLSLPRGPLKSLFALCLAVSLAGAVFMVVAFGDWRYGVSRLIGEDAFTLDGRIALWRYALEHAADSPILGIGYYNSRILLLPMFPFAGHCHNSFIEVLLTTGAAGLVMSLLYVALLVRAAVVSRDRFLVGALATLWPDMMLDPSLFSPSFTMFVLTAAAIEAYAGAPARPRAAAAA